MKARAAVLAGSRMTNELEIVITASPFPLATAESGRAVERLVALLRSARTRHSAIDHRRQTP
jgi:hypothetical protein